jgi:hypothetical protein
VGGRIILDSPIEKRPDLIGGYRWHFAQSHMTAALWQHFHSGQYRHLAASTAAPFAGFLLAADVGVIQLNQPPKAVAGISVLSVGLSI